ncbi:hypothetical protein Ctob_009866 [Chrysochromulina tobinii]|uniref:Transmembrane protein n=1 Tax=Chrysochromulina tobinii TaxID=1460289 RepID=A0A0M0JS75_9EUKA|nr:hypothetical protein Ctob_009866 [Chrysochromulina tobinii]|eukprot:KOO29365.1 hypothetical protein Ctob_009866 [Chrysochromulina sp. CCMP291]
MLNSTSTGFLLVTSTVVLIASLFLTNDPVDTCAVSGGMQYCVGWNNAYAFVWSIMEIVLCAVGLVALKYKPDLLSKVLVAKVPLLYAPITVESLLSFVLFLNATIGALIMTNQPEHGFDQTNNGYFACWAGVCAALGNIGVDAIKNGEDIAKKGVSPAWGIIISSIMQFEEVEPPQDEMTLGRELQEAIVLYNTPAMVFAFWLSVATIIVATIFVFRPTLFAGKIAMLGTLIKLVMLVSWVVEAFWTTFPGSSPFHVTGNGYFGSWLAVAFAAQMFYAVAPAMPEGRTSEVLSSKSVDVEVSKAAVEEDAMAL